MLGGRPIKISPSTPPSHVLFAPIYPLILDAAYAVGYKRTTARRPSDRVHSGDVSRSTGCNELHEQTTRHARQPQVRVEPEPDGGLGTCGAALRGRRRGPMLTMADVWRALAHRRSHPLGLTCGCHGPAQEHVAPRCQRRRAVRPPGQSHGAAGRGSMDGMRAGEGEMEWLAAITHRQRCVGLGHPTLRCCSNVLLAALPDAAADGTVAAPWPAALCEYFGATCGRRLGAVTAYRACAERSWVDLRPKGNKPLAAIDHLMVWCAPASRARAGRGIRGSSRAPLKGQRPISDDRVLPHPHGPLLPLSPASSLEPGTSCGFAPPSLHSTAQPRCQPVVMPSAPPW